MKCDAVKKLLWAYLEQETTAEETAQIKVHLADCAACREELKLQEEIKKALESLPDEELPNGYHAELMKKLQAETTQKTVPFPVRKKMPRWKQLSMIAAAVLVVVAAGGMEGMLQMRQNQNDATQRLAEEPRKDAVTEDTGTELFAELETATAQERTTQDEMPSTEENTEQELSASVHRKAAATPKQDNKKTTEKTVGKQAEKATEKATAPPMAEEQAKQPQVSLFAEQAEAAADEAEGLVGATRSINDRAIDSITLLTEDKTAALQAIRSSIEEYGGYEEESAEAETIQAVLPQEGYQAFVEQITKLGEVQEFSQAAEQEDAVLREIRISVEEG